MNLPIRNRKKVVAARATERGIAGHQAAMDALRRQTGYEHTPGMSFAVNMKTGNSAKRGIGHVRLRGEDAMGNEINEPMGHLGLFNNRIQAKED